MPAIKEGKLKLWHVPMIALVYIASWFFVVTLINLGYLPSSIRAWLGELFAPITWTVDKSDRLVGILTHYAEWLKSL